MSSIADDCDAAARAVRRSDNLFMVGSFEKENMEGGIFIFLIFEWNMSGGKYQISLSGGIH